MKDKIKPVTVVVPRRLQLVMAACLVGFMGLSAPLAAQDEFKQKRYACLIAGASVYSGPGRANKKLFDLPFGEETAMGGSQTVREKSGVETWVKVKHGTAVGWTLEYSLAPQRPKKEDYLEAPDSLLGTWTTYYGNHPIFFTFKTGGECNVEGCSMVIGGSEAGGPMYTWEGDEGTITITAFGPGSGEEGETAFAWNIREQARFYLLVDDSNGGSLELFRSSLLVRAVASGSLNHLRALFANNRYTPADFDKHLVFDDYYDEARDPEQAERERQRLAREEAMQQQDEEIKRWNEAPAGEYWGPPPTLYGDELLPPAPCTHPTGLEMIRLPLLGIALSAQNFREDAALFLIERGADVNAFVKKGEPFQDEELVNEPLLVYLKKHGAVQGCALLLKHDARTDMADSAGRTYADLSAKESVRRIDPREGLKLRSSPSLDGVIVATIPYNAEVLVLDETGGEVTIKGRTGRWTRVTWNTTTGWVFGGFLK